MRPPFSGVVVDAKPTPYTGDPCGSCGAMTVVEDRGDRHCVSCGWQPMWSDLKRLETTLARFTTEELREEIARREGTRG